MVHDLFTQRFQQEHHTQRARELDVSLELLVRCLLIRLFARRPQTLREMFEQQTALERDDAIELKDDVQPRPPT